MNIILTGPKHCGKSTLVSKIIENYRGRISGFISEFDDRSSDTRKLLIRSINGADNACAVTWSNSSYSVNFDVFDIFAPELIDLSSDLIVFDELGKFESSCNKLQDAVEQAFSSATDVIAVLRLDAPAWINELKLRSDVMVIIVNTENRDNLVCEINDLINS